MLFFLYFVFLCINFSFAFDSFFLNRHLDGRSLNIDCNHVLNPTSKVLVSKEGFPKTDGGNGDLIINFRIQFPTHLTSTEQDDVSRILSKKFKK